MSALRGVGWDHPRCRAPLEAAARVRDVCWDFRSLAAFNDQPLTELSADYDVLVVDHPHVAAAAAAGALAPLDRLLEPEMLAVVAADTIGPSFASYAFRGHQWALPVDAACQVSADRPDLLAEAGASRPRTWAQVLELARILPGSVALPLTPADALCSLLTLCSQHGAPVRLETGLRFDRGALELLVELAALVGEDSFSQAPPALLERLQRSSELLFVPLTFGYTDFSRPGEDHAVVRFGPPPTLGDTGGGPVLGGAGVAASACRPRAVEAAELCAWLASSEVQHAVMLPAGGQPASAAVWADPAADASVGGFFSGTAAALEGAYVRPSHPDWPAFQEAASRTLAESLAAGATAETILARLDELARPVSAASAGAVADRVERELA